MSADEIRVLQATAWYPPHDVGGTEVYLEALIGELRLVGVTSSVIKPRAAGAVGTHVHAGTLVETYAVNETPTSVEVREGRPHLDFDAFCARLAAHRGAIYHQHSWSRGCGSHHLRAARDLGLRTVLTVHVPGNICLRGTMMRYGTRPCDGLADERQCGACWAQGRGLPRVFADAVAGLPLSIARRARRGRSRIATALAARALGDEHSAQLGEMINNADRLVVVCGWLRDALITNGVPPDRLVLNRQGLSAAFLSSAPAAKTSTRRDANGPLKLLYVGRWHPVKGVDVVVQAVRALPKALNVQLCIHAVPGTAEELVYEQNVRRLAGDETRITFAGPVSHGEVARLMTQHDALVVPSVWLETGPLVVLEAQAVGLYVVGSRLGGIAELIGDGLSGELVKAGDVRAWTDAITRLAGRSTSSVLSRQRRPVRKMAEVAAEMAQLYRSLLAGSRG